MIFNDTTTAKTGLTQQVRFLTGSNADSFPIEDVTRLANISLDKYFTMALQCNNNWKLDDTTYTDYSIATTDLVSGQVDYNMPVELIDIVSVKIKDASGVWKVLEQANDLDFTDPATEVRFATPGTPQFYLKRSDGIFLLSATSYNSTAGMKLEYKRIANYFIRTDTTKQAGIPRFHDMYLCYHIGYNYALAKNLANTGVLGGEMVRLENDVKYHWSKRGKEKPARISPLIQDTR